MSESGARHVREIASRYGATLPDNLGILSGDALSLGEKSLSLSRDVSPDFKNSWVGALQPAIELLGQVAVGIGKRYKQ